MKGISEGARLSFLADGRGGIPRHASKHVFGLKQMDPRGSKAANYLKENLARVPRPGCMTSVPNKANNRAESAPGRPPNSKTNRCCLGMCCTRASNCGSPVERDCDWSMGVTASFLESSPEPTGWQKLPVDSGAGVWGRSAEEFGFKRVNPHRMDSEVLGQPEADSAAQCKSDTFGKKVEQKNPNPLGDACRSDQANSVPLPVKTSRPSPPRLAPPPPPPCKKGTKATLPEWCGPRPPPELAAERVVNWQPMRQAGRWEGSVWKELHNKMQKDGIMELPTDLLDQAFMRRLDDTPKRNLSRSSSRRRLPQNRALTADLLHKQLQRHGMETPAHLCWAVGRQVQADVGHVKTLHTEEASKQESVLPPDVSEEILETLLGLLQIAAGNEEQLFEADGCSEAAPAEAFLLQLLPHRGSASALQPRVDMALHILRFSAEADRIELSVHVALKAIRSMVSSGALMELLEGVLILGNYVNAGCKPLSAAVSVSLDSLAKLAHTKCLPTLQEQSSSGSSSRLNNALHLLVQHLQQSRPSFRESLLFDLEDCHTARDVDPKDLARAVEQLAAQTQAVEQRIQSGEKDAVEGYGEPESLKPEALQGFVVVAKPRVTGLKCLLQELENETRSMRQWFAEPPTKTFVELMQNFEALREALPSARRAGKTHRTARLPSGVPRSSSRHSTASPSRATSSDTLSECSQTASWPEPVNVSVVSHDSSPSPSEPPQSPEFTCLPHSQLNLPQDHPAVTQQIARNDAGSNVFPCAALPAPPNPVPCPSRMRSFSFEMECVPGTPEVKQAQGSPTFLHASPAREATPASSQGLPELQTQRQFAGCQEGGDERRGQAVPHVASPQFGVMLPRAALPPLPRGPLDGVVPPTFAADGLKVF